ncbi:hypothetical protein AMATHDRAFT_67596 [Amanita thiersii Skay4041]|uniref:Peptide hydrolase n=1 Tax=Amanita thiersii Skay4041 TaxID=703135 RepID=A0A2A9N9B5_9AGAR|nr:hypothetical protein AMATHDRAFT_67596 [Amanita thiersii Skay4041]
MIEIPLLLSLIASFFGFHTLVAPNNHPGNIVTSEALTNTIDGTNLMTHAETLFSFAKNNGGSRAFGSQGHNETVDYIKSRLDATGYYDTQLQTLQEFYSHGTASLSVDGQAYNATWPLYSPGGHVTGPLVTVNNFGCRHRNYPEDMTGKIALIRRGTCSAALKVALARRLGAAGAIIYNNATDSFTAVVSPTPMEKGPTIPSCGISGSDGQKLLAEIKAGKCVIGTLNVDAINENRFTRNVVATTKKGDRKNVIMVGGHTDSPIKSPGMNDNASGSMAILEIALQLARFEVKNAVRFGFWAAGESGLAGTGYYLSSLSTDERRDIALYLDVDMIASPNFGYFVYNGDGSRFNTSGFTNTQYNVSGPLGSDWTERVFQDYYNAAGVITAPANLLENTVLLLFGYCGIPISGIVSRPRHHKREEEFNWWGGSAGTEYDPCSRKTCDDVQNLNVTAWVTNAKAVAHAVSTFATSLDGIPRPQNITRGIPSRRVSVLNTDAYQVHGYQVPLA